MNEKRKQSLGGNCLSRGSLFSHPIGLAFLVLWTVLSAAELLFAGERPYELEWAGRTDDDHPPLVNFEHDDGWTVEPEVAAGSAAGQASLTLSGGCVAGQ